MQRISNDLFEAIRAVTHPVLAEAKLDPVGKEDADVDNDDKVGKSDDYLKNRRKAISASIKKEEVVVEGSGSKEKQKTPYRDINSPEYRAAVEKQKQKMKDTAAAQPGKKMLSKMNKEEVEQADEATSFDSMKHITDPQKKKELAPYAKLVDRGSYAQRAAMNKAGGVKDDRGPRGVTQEEIEEVEENMHSSKAGGMGVDLGTPGKNFSKISKAAAKKYGSLSTKMRKEEAELDEGVTETIVKHNDFTVEITDNPTFGDFLRAVQSIVRTDEEAAQIELISIAEQAFKENNDEIIIESFTRMEIQDKINSHRKAGNTVSDDKYSTKGGQPYAEYVVTDSEGGRKKYIHHGSVRRLESLPPAKKAK
jgi:hypothetical protein